MGLSSGGKKRYQSMSYRNKQRASMSFFIVIMFFAVLAMIVFTEFFFMDEAGRAGGVLVRHGSHRRQFDRSDYDDALLNDDYISIRVGMPAGLDDTVGALLMGERLPAPIPVITDDKRDASKSQVITEAQLPPYPVNITPSDGNWQNVNGTKNKFHVFSAFHDRRKGQKAVRIIGATKTRLIERVWCRLWYRNSETGNSSNVASRTVQAKIKVIRENWNLRYSACFVMCPLQGNQSAPFAVSVVAKLRFPPANLVAVIDSYNETRAANKFAVCVKPIHFDYNKALQIMEFIELNRLMGIEHFIFYNHTIGAQGNCIFEDYVARGIATVLPWQLNIVSQKEIRTENMFAALNDCLYRSMYRFSHILLIDFDEFIIPRHNNTLPELLDWLGMKMNSRTTGSYSAQNAFFYLQWGDDDWTYSSDDDIATNLITLRKTRRKTKLHPHKQRSKYICKPEFVVEVGNHFVWEFMPGYGTYNVPSDAAILHHYRICEFGGDDCVKSASTLDRTAFRYRTGLVDAVKHQQWRLKNMCHL